MDSNFAALRRRLFIVTVALSIAASASSQEIHGCGGFVGASSGLIDSRASTDSKLDYSHITVELYTVDGLVKESTQCAPNGYYFLPVYDQGSFIVRVKGPNGWSWVPESTPVIVDHTGCNGNMDINFQFTGFTISGRVLGSVSGQSCSLKDRGPSGVRIELLSQSNEIIASALTTTKGEYLFTNITPGRYRLQATHSDFQIERRGSTEVDVRFGNAVADDAFYVSGYNIYGSVIAQGNPILGVHMYLRSDDVSEVHCPQGIGETPVADVLCHAISDSDGKFMFGPVPCGTYELIPYYKGENTIFDVSPTSLLVFVEHNHVTVPQKFQVTGFSIGGRVIDGNGNGVEGVKVKVDGELRVVTDNLGYYKLDQVTSKEYSIVAEKDHYKFKSLENFLVLPNMAHIDDIVAVQFELCGIVRMETANSKAMVTLTHGHVKPQKKVVDANGSFCFEVPAGEYRLSAVAVDPKASPGLVFSPSFLDVKVHGPVLTMEFSQSQVNVAGKVICKERCTSDVMLSLVRLDSGSDLEKRTISLGQDDSTFLFTKVFPGKYSLEVKHKSLSMTPVEDDWCWEQNIVELDLSSDVTEIVFVQKGYLTQIVSSHETDAYIHRPDSSKQDITIKKGSQMICIEDSGQHEFLFLHSCISFGSSSVVFDTRRPMPINLSAKKYLVRGEITVDLLDETCSSEDIVVDLYKSDGSLVATLPTTAIDGNVDNNLCRFEYTVWADLGDNFIFAPRDISVKKKKVLFYPPQRQVLVSVSGCQDSVPAMSGRVGLYLDGSVSPAISGIDVRIIAAGESRYVPLKQGDLVLEVVTNLDGFFSAGPLYDDISYIVEASKAGHHLKKTGPYTFVCQKLGQIFVHIYGDNNIEPFPPVLLSLSGDGGYRNNTISGIDGTFIFENLFPGTFHLRPLLKEYSFSPSAVTINLESGESREINFYATRIAFSAMGSVTLLSGHPKENVFIEARSETKSFYEEAKTDSLGKFRLRGLVPNTTYTVRIIAKEKLGLSSIERASPKHVSVEVGSEDITDLNFVVFERPDDTILSGHVEGDDLVTLQPHLSLEIRLASDPSTIKSVFPLPLSNFFQVRDLPKRQLLIQLRYGLPSISHKFESEILEVDLETQPHVHIGPLTYKLEEHHHKQEPAPAPLVPLIVGISAIAFIVSLPRLRDLYQTTVGASASGSSSVVAARRPGLRRRA